MTVREKHSLALFLDTAEDYLRDGYRLDRGEYFFSGDPLPLQARPSQDRPAAEARGIGLEEPAVSEKPEDSLERIVLELAGCGACSLGKTRNKVVPGEGSPRPLALVIGEGPGADEDASGRPFVGRAGQLLDTILSKIGLFRDRNCFIANVVKCHPPGNRDPLDEEIAACALFLSRQIGLLKPKAILCVGRVAARTLLNRDEGIGKLRGRFYDYRGTPLLATYHPSALLRDEALKRPVWEDMKLFRVKLAELDSVYAAELSTETSR
jgi:DNA polymerase